MSGSSCRDYAVKLRGILAETLSAEYVEEIVSEATNHLSERAEELRNGGLSISDAELQAVHEFGEVDEIAIELAKGYPPKPPMNPKQLRWLPEASIVFLALAFAYSYSIYGGWRGLEAAAGNITPLTPMFIIPGMTGALTRLKYQRLRPISIQLRMATYGVTLSLIGMVCLLGLQVMGHATLTTMYPIYYLFGSTTILLYVVMRTANADGRIFNYVRGRLRQR